MDISVVGAGYLGAVHATALASAGLSVTAVERDGERVASLNAGVPTFHEPGFPELLAATLATGRLRFTNDLGDIAACQLHFLCVGTPQQLDGTGADLSQVWGAVAALADVVAPGSILVGKSTVPVGTAVAIQQYLDARGSDVAVLWNPEFLREGFAVRDTLEPDRIVIGAPDGPRGAAAVEVLRRVYRTPLDSGVPLVQTDIATAELVKMAANAFLATKISFINAMAEVCEATGGEVSDLASAIGLDARIGSRFLRAGLGFGGGCLPKDIRAFTERASQLGLGESVAFLKEMDAINERCRTRAVAATTAMLGEPRGKVACVLGAAFKPDSDDVRDSPALDVARQLQGHGMTVRVHDPAALANAARTHAGLHYEPDLTTALAGADIVLVLTEWAQYTELDPATVAGLVAQPRVFDGRNCLPAERWRAAGWRYAGMGLGRSAPVAGRRVDVREAQLDTAAPGVRAGA